MRKDRHLVTNCTFCGIYFGSPPTGVVYDANTDTEFEDYWVGELDPHGYSDDYKQADIYHPECWQELQSLINQIKNNTLGEYA